MQLYGRVILSVFVFCSAVVSLAAAPVLTPPKRVLIFYPERPDTPGHMLFEQHLRSTLGADRTHRIDFYTEYMDISRFSGETYVSTLYELYRQKYAGRTMDLIITVTRRPLQFVIQYQHELFPGIPVVFCSIDAETLRGLHLGPPMTGIVRHLDFAGTLDLALRLHPRTRCVVVLSGTSPTDHFYRQMAEPQLARFHGTVEITSMGDLPMAELVERVSRLPDDTIVLYLIYFRDGDGRAFLGLESGSLLAQAANVPVYSVFEVLLGAGVVGGHMYSHMAVGAQVGALGRQILNGQAPEALQVPEAGTNEYLFDWRQLRRWGISEAELPPGSIVHNRELSVWEQYRGYIIGGMLLCLVEGLLIVALMLERRQRRQLERWLADRLRFEMLSSDLSSSFINLSPADNLEKPILAGLQHVTEYIGADRGNLAEFVEGAGTFRVRHSWAVEGVEPLSTAAPVGRFPWCLDQLLQGHTIRYTSLDELPEAAATDRQSFGRIGTRSAVLVPLIAANTILGALAMARLQGERAWTEEQVQRLRFLGEIFAHVLLRQRTEQASRVSEALSSAVLASLRGLVAVIDRHGIIVAVNASWSRFAREHQDGPLNRLSVGANYLDVCRQAARAHDPTATRALAGIESVLSGAREEFSLEYVCAPAEEEVWYMMTVVPLRRPESGVVIAHRDITESRQAEMTVQRHQQELAHVARVTMMGELTASLAHEINHPLAAIMSNAQAAQRFMEAQPPDLAEVREILADIVADDHRAVEVIRRLRRFLTKSELERFPVDLNQVICEVTQLLRHDALIRRVTFSLDLDGDLPAVSGDRVQLQQVLMNLILNGFEAMVPGTIEDRLLVVRSRRPEAEVVEVAVQDRGHGVMADQLESIFEPFYTTKAEGMGMGLAICRSIVEAHGGRLWVANNLDRGATFFFSLPVRGEGT